MSWLSRAWAKFRNARSFVMPPPQWRYSSLPAFEAGLPLTVDEALRVSVVWACMDWHVRCLAARPWQVYDVNGDKKSIRRGERLSYLFNTRPNPQMTAIALREALQYAAFGWGNGYAEIVPDGRGEPAELWPIEPDRCIPWRHEDTQEVGYRIYQYWGGTTWVPGSRIYHLRAPATYNGIVGDNLLVRASRSIAIAASAQAFSAGFFANGTVLAGVIEGDAKIPDPQVVENIRQQFAEKYAGPRNAGGPMVLHGGFKWKEIQSDPNKAQLLETRKFQVEEIARFFGVPLHAIGVQAGAHGYGTNIEQMGIEAVRTAIRPWAERFEQEADFKLLPERSRMIRETKIDLSELTLGDKKSQIEAASAAVAGGLLTINEARAQFGWNDIGSDGDVHFLPSTAKTVEQIIAPPAPPALPAKTGGAGDGEATPSTAGEVVNREPRQLAAALLTRALDDHARRWRARRKDLETHVAPVDLSARLESARSELRAKLDPEFAPLCEAVEAGAEPRKVALYHLQIIESPPEAA